MSPEDHGVINKTVRLLPLFHRVISGAVAPQTEEEQVSDDYSEEKKEKKKKNIGEVGNKELGRSPEVYEWAGKNLFVRGERGTNKFRDVS